MNNDEQRSSSKKPRPLMLALMLTGTLFLQGHPKVTPTARALPDPLAIAQKLVRNTRTLLTQNIDSSLPESIANAVRQDLAKKLGIPVLKLNISHYSWDNWSQTCQSSRADELCDNAIVEGWRIVVSDGWIYRSDPQGNLIQLENRQVSVGQLPATVSTAVLLDAARRSELDLSEINIVRIESREWESSCLGLDTPGTVCQTGIVPGWLAIVAGGNGHLVYHADKNGNSVLLNTDLSSEFLTAQQPPLPTALAEVVKQDLSDRFEIAPEQLQVSEYRRQTWSDGCLGLASPKATCDRKTVEGWLLVLSDGRSRWVYRTDFDGKTVRLENSIEEHK